MANGSVLKALRDATGDAHRALEIAADVEARLRDPVRRPLMIVSLLAFHHGAETLLSPWNTEILGWGAPVANRSISLRLDADLLGIAARRASPYEGPCCPAEALGWTYVLEGSALGGRVMLNRMIADGIELRGLSHMAPQPLSDRSRWRDLMTAFEAADRSGVSLEHVAKGGLAAFAFAHQELVSLPSTEAV